MKLLQHSLVRFWLILTHLDSSWLILTHLDSSWLNDWRGKCSGHLWSSLVAVLTLDVVPRTGALAMVESSGSTNQLGNAQIHGISKLWSQRHGARLQWLSKMLKHFVQNIESTVSTFFNIQPFSSFLCKALQAGTVVIFDSRKVWQLGYTAAAKPGPTWSNMVQHGPTSKKKSKKSTAHLFPVLGHSAVNIHAGMLWHPRFVVTVGQWRCGCTKQFSLSTSLPFREDVSGRC